MVKVENTMGFEKDMAMERGEASTLDEDLRYIGDRIYQATLLRNEGKVIGWDQTRGFTLDEHREIIIAYRKVENSSSELMIHMQEANDRESLKAWVLRWPQQHPGGLLFTVIDSSAKVPKHKINGMDRLRASIDETEIVEQMISDTGVILDTIR